MLRKGSMPETTGMLPSYARPAAMPTHTCSASPTSRNRSGNLSRNSTRVAPMSGVSTHRFG